MHGALLFTREHAIHQCDNLLNQAHAWFLKIDPVRIVSMRVCVRVRAQGY